MKIIFIGTTKFGIPTLEILNTKYQILAVITQPDQPVGRKKTITPPPIKVWAQKNGIPVLQPEKLSDTRNQITDIMPDLLLVAAYGQLIPKEILDIPKYGSINVHGSLLPKYRGASPTQTAILNGDKTTGITLFLMDEKLDHGPVIAQQTLTIDDHTSYLSLYKRLSETSAGLVSKTLPQWFAGQIKPIPQDENQASYTKIFSWQDGRIDWTKKASEIEKKILSLNPEPGTWTTYINKSVKILEVIELRDQNPTGLAGKISQRNKQMIVQCKTCSLIIVKLQPEGKKPMPGADFLNGLKDKQNAIFI
ncbi:MAG: methionyl-tRNA formyltransferase [Candidatus Doudnabacteria bacterium]|nr:methionyl-tRNA formyltransferase [Candidatus Doudnabacteria bacterium]